MTLNAFVIKLLNDLKLLSLNNEIVKNNYISQIVGETLHVLSF